MEASSFLFSLLAWSIWWNILFHLLARFTKDRTKLQCRIALTGGCYSHIYAVVKAWCFHERYLYVSIIVGVISVGSAIWTYSQGLKNDRVREEGK